MMQRITFLCLPAIMGIYLCACKANGSEDNNSKDIQSVPVMQIVQKDTTVNSHYVTAIEARRNVEIRAKVPGFLDKIFVDEGQHVQQGQLLFKINDRELAIALDKARAALSSTQAEALSASLEMNRVQLLVNKNIIAKSELELAKARLKAAEARVSEAKATESEAQQRLSYTAVYAPFSGVIDRIPLRSGSLLDQGSLLTTVSDLDQVHAYFNVSENEYLQMIQDSKDKSTFVGSRVNLILANNTVYPQPGKIETAEGEFDEATGSIAFRATFPNPGRMLKHGSSGKIQITTPVHQALLVPHKAVFEIQDKNYVYVVDKQNKVRMKNFVPRMRLSDCYIVESGLNSGESIVLEGIQTIRDGATIQPVAPGTDSLIARK